MLNTCAFVLLQTMIVERSSVLLILRGILASNVSDVVAELILNASPLLPLV